MRSLPVSSHVIWKVMLTTPQANRRQFVPLLLICEQMLIALALSFLSDQHSYTFLFLAIGFLHKKPAKVGDSQPDEIGREGVAYIVLYNTLDIAIKPHLSYVLPINELPIYVHHLAGDTSECGQFVQRWHCLPPATDDVFEIDMPLTPPGKVVFPLPGLVRSCAEGRQRYPLDNAPLDENLQVGSV